jgi:hypothetical protein
VILQNQYIIHIINANLSATYYDDARQCLIDDDVSGSIRDLLDAAVHKRTMAERRIGCLLSGTFTNPVADPGVFTGGGGEGPTIKFSFQKPGKGMISTVIFGFQGGFHSQNALFLPYIGNIF